jgi:hypothetical protein
MVLRALASAALATAALLPDRAVRDGPVVCLFRRVTGLPCPSCGLTRSWQAAGHGRLRQAVAFHPLGPLTMLAAAWLAVDPTAERRLAARGSETWTSAMVVGWLATWLWRLSRRR